MASIGLHVDQHAVDFIKDFEGLSLDAYDDGTGTPTICYGHVEGVHMGDHKTRQECENLLLHDLQGSYKAGVDNYIRDAGKLPWPAQTALLSACYNLGPGYVAKLSPFVNKGMFQSAANLLRQWDHDIHGNRLAGLTRRRNAEAHLLEVSAQKKWRLTAELTYLRYKARKAGGWDHIPARDWRRARSIRKWLGGH